MSGKWEKLGGDLEMEVCGKGCSGRVGMWRVLGEVEVLEQWCGDEGLGVGRLELREGLEGWKKEFLKEEKVSIRRIM